jgi:hypothetical protein
MVDQPSLEEFLAKPDLGKPSPLSRDSLTQMGGLYFGADASLRYIPKQQLDAIKSMHGELKHIREMVEATTEEVRN